MKRDLSKPLASTFGEDEPKGRSLKSATASKKATIYESNDRVISGSEKDYGRPVYFRSNTYEKVDADSEGRAIAPPLSGRTGEKSASGKVFGPKGRDAEAREAVNKVVGSANKEKRRKDIYKIVDARMAAEKRAMSTKKAAPKSMATKKK